jgi:type I restriction enzyme S subunit
VEADLGYLSKGSTFDSVNSIEVKNLKLIIPSDIEEQTAIANIFSDMDAEIEALEQKLNKYKAIKQGMMQELLTGRIRLI